MSHYILVWEGSCDPEANTETISVPEGKVVYMTRAPQVHNASVTVTNCTQKLTYTMPSGGNGNSMQIPVNDGDKLCFTARSSTDAHGVNIDVISPRV